MSPALKVDSLPAELPGKFGSNLLLLGKFKFCFLNFLGIFFLFWPPSSLWDLILQREIEPMAPTVGAQNLNHWPARKVPIFLSVFDPRLVDSTDAKPVDVKLTDTEVQLHSQLSVGRTEVERTSNRGSFTVPQDYHHVLWNEGFPGGARGKESTCQCRRQEMQVRFLGGKIPWRRTQQPTPVFLPGKSHGQRALAAIVHRVTKSQVQLKGLSTDAHYGMNACIPPKSPMWKL